MKSEERGVKAEAWAWGGAGKKKNFPRPLNTHKPLTLKNRGEFPLAPPSTPPPVSRCLLGFV